MADGIEGGVSLNRIFEYLLANPANIPNLSLLMDVDGADQAVEVPFSMLENALSQGIYEPSVQPVISGGILPLDCSNRQEVVFEPRLSVGTRTINTNFSIAFSNITGTIVPHCIFEFTGTVIVTMPADVRCSNPSSIGVWNEIAGTLTLTTVIADNIEFSFIKDNSSAKWNLIVSEIAI